MNDPRFTLARVAGLVGGRVEGDETLEIRGVASLEDAGPDEMGLLADRRYVEAAGTSAAGALLVSGALLGSLPETCASNRVVVEDAHAALVPLLGRMHPEPRPDPGVHATAVLGHGVELGADVCVGPYAVLEDGVHLGDRCRIGAHAVLGRGSQVGEDSRLHPHVVLYAGTVVGRRVTIHAGAHLGVDGFGYAMVDGTLAKVPQVGRCVVEDDVEIGAGTCLDRGSIGETRVGAATKLDNLVHLAHNVRVGPGCAMAAQVGIAGSTSVGSGVMLGGQAGVRGHVRIGDRAEVSAQAGVIGDVAAGETVTGFPARDLRTYLRASAHFLRLPELTRRLKEAEEAVTRLTAARGDDGG